MRQSDPRFLRRDATNLLVSLLRQGDQVALAEFGDGVREITNGAVILDAQTRVALLKATQKVTSQDKHTDILAACQHALNLISSLPLEVRKSFAPSVILLTDGKDDVPGGRDRTVLIEEKIKELAQLGVVVHTVGFSQGADIVLLRKIADLTGGDMCVINQDVDLLRGFFGLSRVLGRRWSLTEQTVGGGGVKLAIPNWAGRVVACYLPRGRTADRLLTPLPPAQVLIQPHYQVLMFDKVSAASLDLTIPAVGGSVFLDAEGDMVLQALVGKKVPARLPFQLQARIMPARPGDLGQPRFLAQTAVSISLEREGEPGATVRLYDDGQHDDGPARDGVFGGYVLLPHPGMFKYRLVAKAPLSPALLTSGQIEALDPAVAVTPPGFWTANVLAHFARRLTWTVCNRTDVQLIGNFTLFKAGQAVATHPLVLSSGTCKEMMPAVGPLLSTTGPIKGRVLLKGRQEMAWEGDLWIRPLWHLVAGGLAIIILVGLTFVLPRRSPDGQIIVTGEMEGRQLTESIKINALGCAEVSGLPEPLGDPGVFKARSGCWRKGVIFTPHPQCQPQFIRKVPPRTGKGYLLKGPTTWNCRFSGGTAEYTYRPKRR